MSDPQANTQAVSAVEEIKANPGLPPDNNYTLETLAFFVNKERVNHLDKKLRTEFKELRTRQNQVKFLHQLLKSINVATDSEGKFDCTNNKEFQEMCDKAREMGVEIDPKKTKYTRDERERFVDNLRMSCEDLNVQNEMQLQVVSRLTNERYESFQLARSIIKPLHEDKVNKARSIAR